MPTGVYVRTKSWKHSKEWKNKMSERMRGKQYALGYRHSEEFKRKMSEMRKGKKPYKMTDRARSNMSNTHKGIHLSEAHKQHISEALKGKTPKNLALINSPNKKMGKNHWNWKGGITPFRTKIWHSSEYKKWRMAVFIRDNFTCQFCGVRSHMGLGKTVYLEAHHIKSFKDYPELRLVVENGITLCRECHNLTKHIK
jgi:hypothetical protein